VTQMLLFSEQVPKKMEPVFVCPCGYTSPVCWFSPDEPPLLTLEDDDDTVWCRGCCSELRRVQVTVFYGESN